MLERNETTVDNDIARAGVHALQQAGAVLREYFGRARSVAYKGSRDLVTDADRRSEDMIVEFLMRRFPDAGILAEERPEIGADTSCRWIVDPLDGTTNYAHGYPFFCVSLAFEHNRRIVWGGVYDPLREELFTATSTGGACLNDAAITVSRVDRLDRALLCTGFPYDVHESSENNLDHFAAFVTTAQAVRRDGAAALDLCYVAAGRFDGFWEMKLKPWDIAAGSLIVTAAGGFVSQFDGSPFDVTRGDVVATNNLLHPAMVSILQKGKPHAG